MDECELMTHHCMGLARCVNTVGSYLCSCPPGYSLTDENSCSGELVFLEMKEFMCTT